MANREVPFEDGMKVGLGYDRLTGDVMPTSAITFPSVSAPAGAGGQHVTNDCVVIQDVDTLHKSLGISVDAGGSYMGFSANAKVDYASQCDFSSFSTYTMVQVSVSNPIQTADAPSLNSDGSQLIVNDLPDRFRQRFGDGFISGLKTGGEFFAIYQITSTDQSERESLAVKVQASFDDLVASAHLSTDIQLAVANSHSHLEVHIHVYRDGTISAADFQVDDIMAAARQFPIDVSGANAFTYAALIQDYDGLASPNDKFNYIEIEQRQDVLADLARKRFQFLSLRDDLVYALNHSDDFVNADGSPIDRSALDAERMQVVTVINTMEEAAAACARDASNCTFPIFDTSSYVLPKPKPPSGTIAVVAGPNSVAAFPHEVRDIPQQCTITTTITVVFAESTITSARYAGVGFFNPLNNSYDGVAMFVNAQGHHWGRVSGQVGHPPTILDSDTVNAGTNTISVELDFGGYINEFGYSVTIPGGGVGGGVGNHSGTVAPDTLAKLIFFAFSEDDAPFVAAFAEPTITIAAPQ